MTAIELYVDGSAGNNRASRSSYKNPGSFVQATVSPHQSATWIRPNVPEFNRDILAQYANALITIVNQEYKRNFSTTPGIGMVLKQPDIQAIRAHFGTPVRCKYCGRLYLLPPNLLWKKCSFYDDSLSNLFLLSTDDEVFLIDSMTERYREALEALKKIMPQAIEALRIRNERFKVDYKCCGKNPDYVDFSNNQAELLAVLFGVQKVLHPEQTELTIHTDSQYVYNVLNNQVRIHKNKDLIQIIVEVLAKFPVVKFIWKKRNSLPELDFADLLSKLGEIALLEHFVARIYHGRIHSDTKQRKYAPATADDAA